MLLDAFAGQKEKDMAVPFKYNSILHGVPAVKQAAVKPEPRSVNNQNNFCVHLQNYLQNSNLQRRRRPNPGIIRRTDQSSCTNSNEPVAS